MLKKAFNATNRMCFLYHEKAELEELEHQQKCQIEGLRKHYKVELYKAKNTGIYGDRSPLVFE